MLFKTFDIHITYKIIIQTVQYEMHSIMLLRISNVYS